MTGKGFAKVDARSLGKAKNNPPILVPLEKSGYCSLVPENPLASNNITVRGFGDESPGLDQSDGIKLLLHGGEPIGIPEIFANR
jgi:hypothetical protein